MTILNHYINGNANITIYKDGTRTVEYPISGLNLDYPLNIDIRLSNRCPLGFNPKTNKSTCTFCHESARTDGILADLDYLKDTLDKQLPHNFNIELAIGVNEVLPEIVSFFEWCFSRGFIVNATVNQLTISNNRYSTISVIDMINKNYIKGLGVSFRSLDSFHKIPQEIINYENSVVHVIAGIDSIDDVKKLSELGVKKILVLGEKEFGFNIKDFHNKERKLSRIEWLKRIAELFNLFDVVSFDNLALSQLLVKRFFLNKNDWDEKYQGEHSFYINAVEKYFSPSSRSYIKIPMNSITIKDFFEKSKSLDKESNVEHNIVLFK